MTAPTTPSPGYRLPNLLVLGAAKSGTTFIHDELARHPDIFMSAVKEPTFLSDSFQVTKTPMAYAGQFAAARSETWVGESSHVYMSHPDGATVVRTFLNPQRFIVTLRDPVDRALSLFHHMSRHGREVCTSFERALDRETKRLESPRLRWSRRHYFLNFGYVASGRYGEQLDRYLAIFPRDRFLIRFHDELVADSARVMADIHTFLDVTPIATRTDHAANVGGRRARSGPASVALWKASLKMQPERAARARQRLEAMTVAAPPAPTPAQRQRLEPLFAADIVHLETLIGARVPWPWVDQYR